MADTTKSEALKVPFFTASIGTEEEEAVLRVMRSGWLTTGKEALAFEQEFAAKVQTKHALAVNSNTSGMVLAMEACGVKAGKAVITTPYTFVSTAACDRLLGADVYFADIEQNSYSIDPVKIEEIL
ncbi:MAG: DegT/DnrJ/EryC1/StrS family aminotransferase, partial [Treponema sp.]|nr:DegT/DnrJ/EryC1/StrS family aminotransferase [Treponema sp.]